MKTFVFALLAVSSVSAAPVNPPVVRCADEIVRRQVSDGAIVMNGVAPGGNRVVPYFANLAAIGLVAAYQESGQHGYLTAARRWSDWYAAHMNADGTICDYTGSAGAWHSSGGYDSTDSYAATGLELLAALGSQDKSRATARYGTVGRAVAAIRLTLQPDGLTQAKPGWAVAYTMDNIETARGLRAAVRLATLTGHPHDAAAWAAMANRMETAIDRYLWDDDRKVYFVGIQPDGGRMPAQGKWYPDLLANLMAIGWGPDSSHKLILYQRLVATQAATIPARAKTEEDLEHLVWWGFAARAAGDTPCLEKIRAALAEVDPKAIPVANTALLGQLCRLLGQP